MRAAALCGADYALLMEHAPARMSENSSKCLHPPRQKIPAGATKKAIPHVGRTAGFTRFHAGRAGLGAARQAWAFREFFAGAERLVYFVLFPALLFQAILRTPISAGNAALLLRGHGRHDRCRRRAVVAGRPVLRPTSIGLASAAMRLPLQHLHRPGAVGQRRRRAGNHHGADHRLRRAHGNVVAVYGLARPQRRQPAARAGAQSAGGLDAGWPATWRACSCRPVDTVLARLGAAAIARHPVRGRQPWPGKAARAMAR